MRRVAWILPLLIIPPLLQGESVETPSEAVIEPTIESSIPTTSLAIIQASARASAPAVRLTPPTVEAGPPPVPGLKGRPIAPAGLDACEEMNYYRIQWGLPQRFDDSGRHGQWVRSDGLGWRESKCGNHQISSTGCCFGYWQLYTSLFLKDWKLGPMLRKNCDIVDKRDVLGPTPLAKQKQACAAYQLYSVKGLTPWN